MKRKIFLILAAACFTTGTYAQKPEPDAEGSRLMQEGKYKDAAKIYTDAIGANNQVPLYYYKRALAYKKTKDYARAYEDLDRAITLDNSYADAFYERALIHNSASMYAKALSDLDMVMKYSQNDSLKNITYKVRSGIRLAVRNYEGAGEDCRKYLEYKPGDRDALMNLAIASVEKGDTTEALHCLYSIVDAHPKDTFAIMNIGYVFIRMQRFDSAMVYLDRANTLDKKNAFILSNRSYALLKTGRVQEAEKDCNKSLQLDPQNSYAYRNRALIYLEMHQEDKACEDLHMAFAKGFADLYGNEVNALIIQHCRKH